MLLKYILTLLVHEIFSWVFTAFEMGGLWAG
jgi:hypothetical protein